MSAWICKLLSARARRNSFNFLNNKKLRIEVLEDRTMLSAVTVNFNASNNYSILGTVGDQVWLKTNDTTHNIQFSTNVTSYSDLVATTFPGSHPAANVNSDVTIMLGGLGQVHLLNVAGLGHDITLEALGAAGGGGGQLASPNLLSVEQTVYTKGR